MKRKKLLLFLLILLTVILILSIKAYFFLNAKPNIKINYVTNWNELSKPANYDPCQNAIFDYEKVAIYLVEMPDQIKSFSSIDSPRDMNEGQLKLLKEWLEENKQSLELFESGSKKSYNWHEKPEDEIILTIPFPNLPSLRYCATAICLRAQLYAYEKNFNKSFDDIMICYRVGQQSCYNSNGSLVEYLVGLALRGLAVGKARTIIADTQVDTNSLTELQNQLENYFLMENKINLKVEQLFAYDLFQQIFSDNGKGNGHLIPGEVAKSGIFRRSGILNFLSLPSGTKSFRDNIEEFFSKIFGKNKGLNLYWIAVFGPDRKQYTEKLDETYKYYDNLQEKTLWEIKNYNLNGNQLRLELSKKYPIYRYRYSTVCL